jgi:hypothetical protein
MKRIGGVRHVDFLDENTGRRVMKDVAKSNLTQYNRQTNINLIKKAKSGPLTSAH